MAQQFYQIRYYGDDDNSIEKNYPPRSDDGSEKFSKTITDLKNGNNILDLNKKASYMKVHTVPGIKLILNKGISELTASEDWLLEARVQIGATGIYELDLLDYYGIKTISFEPGSLTLINGQDSSYLIINLICKDYKDN